MAIVVEDAAVGKGAGRRLPNAGEWVHWGLVYGSGRLPYGGLVMASALEEVARLRDEIRGHDRKYYVEASPEITDREYDRLMDRLKA